MSWVAVAVGAAAGAGLGAIAGSAKGGDAVWKGALTGAVAGAASGGMYSWAAAPAAAGGLGFGGMGAGALAGGTGGLVSGALGTALNGGNSNDYLRNMFTQGATGAVLGGAGGAAFGPSAGGETGAIATPAAESGLAQGGTGLETGGVQGLGTEATAPGVQQSITGTTAQQAAPSLAQGGTGLETGGAMGGGGSAVAPSLSTTTPTNTQGLNNLYNVDTATGSYGPKGELLGTWDTNANAYVDASKAGLDTANASYGPNGELRGVWDTEQGMYSNQPEFKTGEGGTGWNWKGTGKMDFNDYLSGMGKAQLIGGGLKTLGAIATAPETQANKQALMDLYNQQNQQNQFYANQLQQTYENPQAYLGSPEAQATRSAALQKALAVNAQAGRRTQGGALSNLLMQEQLKNLGAYRQGMPRPNYGTAAQVYQNAAQYSPTADIFGGLASGVTPLSLMSLSQLYGA